MGQDQQPKRPKQSMTGRQAYNVVSDTVTGVNIRLRDNLFQGLAILACLLLGAGIGLLIAAEPVRGALFGSLGGLVVGLFVSGLVLMIFRAVRHARGQHD
jgi:hypothetical protein